MNMLLFIKYHRYFVSLSTLLVNFIYVMCSISWSFLYFAINIVEWYQAEADQKSQTHKRETVIEWVYELFLAQCCWPCIEVSAHGNNNTDSSRVDHLIGCHGQGNETFLYWVLQVDLDGSNSYVTRDMMTVLQVIKIPMNHILLLIRETYGRKHNDGIKASVRDM